ncbi:hypothetical protein ACFQZS_01585 [Mucilaginibacter calamicampi]|uniref:Uncharacterized protein n=1 Tax=Mucilaginibacter calamicampi TaxID=1302352 RepID=A0ABW2YST3_9SPHI
MKALIVTVLFFIALSCDAQVYNFTSHIQYKSTRSGGKSYSVNINEIDTSMTSTFTIDLDHNIFTSRESLNWSEKVEDISSVRRDTSDHFIVLDIKLPKRGDSVWRRFRIELEDNSKVVSIERLERYTGSRFALDTFCKAYTNDAIHLSFYQKTGHVKTQASDTREVLSSEKDVTYLYNKPFENADHSFEVRDGKVNWSEGAGLEKKVYSAVLTGGKIIKNEQETGVMFIWKEDGLTHVLEGTDSKSPVDKVTKVTKLVKLSKYKGRKLVSVSFMY